MNHSRKNIDYLLFCGQFCLKPAFSIAGIEGSIWLPGAFWAIKCKYLPQKPGNIWGILQVFSIWKATVEAMNPILDARDKSVIIVKELERVAEGYLNRRLSKWSI